MNSNQLDEMKIETMFREKFNDEDLKILKSCASEVEDIQADMRVFETILEFVEWYYLDDKESMKKLLNELVNNKDNTSIIGILLPDGSHCLSSGKVLFTLDHY